MSIKDFVKEVLKGFYDRFPVKLGSGDDAACQKNCTASGTTTFAVGAGTTASGYAAYAEGHNTNASGAYSHAGGEGTVANLSIMTAIGRYNESAGSTSNQLFAIGNGGSSSARRTVFSVGGSVGSSTSIVDVNMHGYFHIGDGNDSNAGMEICTTTSGAPYIAFNRGSSSDNYTDWLQVNDGGILRFKTRNSDGAWSEKVKFDAGTVYAANFSQTSDLTKKNIISDISLDKAYELIDKCQTVLYTLKDDPTNKQQVGVIAQEVQQYFPEVVETMDDGTLALSYSRLTVIILKVLKDIIARLNKLEGAS